MIAAKTVKATFAELQAKADLQRHTLARACELALPGADLFTTPNPSADPMQDIYDSTAAIEVEEWASIMQADLVPALQKWLAFDIDPDVRRQLEAEGGEGQGAAVLEQLNASLEAASELTFDAIRHRSNLDLAIPWAFMQLAVCTGALLVRPGDDELWINVEAANVDSILWDEDGFGRPQNVFRKYSEPPARLASRWPSAKWSKAFKDALAKNKKGETVADVDVIDVLSVRKDGGRDYQVVECATGHQAEKAEKTLARWVIFRAKTQPGRMHGRGPFLTVGADARSLNQASKALLTGADRSLMGAFEFDVDGYPSLERLTFKDGTMIPRVPGSSMDRIDLGADVRMADLSISDLRQRVSRGMARKSLPDRENIGRMSAQEVAVRTADSDRRQTPPMARLDRELLRPLAKAIIAILEDRKLLDPLMIDDRLIAMSPKSPLSQLSARREVSDVSAGVAGLMESWGPDAVDGAIKREDGAAWAARKLRIPGDLIRTEKEREDRAAAMQQQALVSEAASSNVVAEVVRQEGQADD